MKKMTVITYQTPGGWEKINLTPRQVETLVSEGRWPKDDLGREYSQVFRGKHYGEPTWASEVDVPDNA